MKAKMQFEDGKIVEEFKRSLSYKELLGIDGEAIEVEWNISQDFRHCRFFKRSRMICERETLSQ